MLAWIEFLVCVALIGVAGVFLTRYGDALADKTGLGGGWIGLILIATVTSLPELAAGVSAVTAANLPEIAVGDVVGSCLFNLLILALIDVLKRGDPLYATVGPEHVLAAGFSILLLGVTGAGLVLSHAGMPLAVGPTGLPTLMLLPLYFVAMAVLHRYQRRNLVAFTTQEPDAYPQLTMRQVSLRYATAALVVITAGVWLPYATAGIATQMSWHEGFAGIMLAAFATSLPELVVTLAALRLGAVDMAVGNIFGSNLFNMVVLATDDLLYAPAPLLSAVSPVHLVSTLVALMMTGIALIGLYYRSRQRLWQRGDWPSLLLISAYVANGVLVFQLTSAA
jgi:cation:H+ antiporter